jgi:trk system potassium uptake protein TrkA
VAKTDRERRSLELVGATRIVSVEAEMGERVARSLLGTAILDHVSLGGGMSIVYWEADERVIGKGLAECRLREESQITVVGVRREDRESLDALPGLEYVFEPGDVLLLAGTDAPLRAFTG